MEDKQVLYRISGLSRHFKTKRGIVRAVDDVSFDIYKGETLSLVGESGCGKTTTGRTILGMYPPTAGKILYKGSDTAEMTPADRKLYQKNNQMIFQDPYACLDPRMTVGSIIEEGVKVHYRLTAEERHARTVEYLKKVGLKEEFSARFPHELSGGQRQRIGIARAMAMELEFIVCDEPIAALDVSIQAQVINLLMKLQREAGLTYLFISHDLSVVRHLSDRIAVMYLGSVVELSDTDSLFEQPLHPYTKALFSAIPTIDPAGGGKARIKLQGEVPSPINPPSGCKFSPRCPYRRAECSTQVPQLREIVPGHFAACHFAENI